MSDQSPDLPKRNDASEPLAPRAELSKTEVDADFRAKALWAGATFSVSKEDVVSSMAAMKHQGHKLFEQLKRAAESDNPLDYPGLLAFTRWLLTRSVRGPKVNVQLGKLVEWEVTQIAESDPEDRDRQFRDLASRLRRLPLGTDGGFLEDVLPETFFLQSGSSEITLRYFTPPPQVMGRMSPWSEIRLLHAGAQAPAEMPLLKGCTACRPDAYSSRGGSKYCVGPDEELELVECQWPPPPPPTPTEVHWDYYVKVGNSWWTMLFGVYHSSAYTKTVQISQSSSAVVPWDVPELYVMVEDPIGNCLATICPGGWCRTRKTAYNTHEVSVGYTTIAYLFGPFGVNSFHFAGGLEARYCDGEWRWYS